MEPKDSVESSKFKGYSNVECEFFPCHQGVKREFNCLFCYCPLIWLKCPGPYVVFVDKNGITRKDCSYCKLPHDGIKASWSFIQKWLQHPIIWDSKEQEPKYQYKGK